jgi:hypothetical protein
MLLLRAVRAAVGSAAKAVAAGSKPYRLVPFHGRQTASLICPASGAACSRAALPVSSRPRPEAAVEEAEAKADLPEAVHLVELLEQARAGLLEQDPLDPLAAVPRLLRARLLAVDRVALEEVLGARAEHLVGPLEGDLAVLVAAAAAQTPSSIPRMAKFLTRRRLAQSPTT